MSKRARDNPEGTSGRAVEQSVNSTRRFQAFILNWRSGVQEEAIALPSQMPPLSSSDPKPPPQRPLSEKELPQSPLRFLPPILSPTASPPTLKGSNGTAVVYDELMTRHRSADPRDCERPMRLERTIEHLSAVGLLHRCHRVAARAARTRELRRVHTREHVEYVDQLDFFMALKPEKGCAIGQDLYACESTSQCARYAAGSVIEAAKAVASGTVQNAFAIVRPPGHHAGAGNPSGFCFFNNVAVAARAVQEDELRVRREALTGRNGDALAERPRIAVFDWDVHHCDGTEGIFYDDPTVLVISVHQYSGGRGHVLRKRPLPPPTEPDRPEGTTTGNTELSLEALAALLPEAAETVNANNAANPETQRHDEKPADTARSRDGERRARAPVDYNRLAQQLGVADDVEAAAFLGVNLASKATSTTTSSASDSSNNSTPDSTAPPLRARFRGDTEGLTIGHSDAGADCEEEEEADLFYPGTGHIHRIGGDENVSARGLNINIPWPTHGMSDVEYVLMLSELVLPVLRDFAPEVLFISCGFDSAAGDPLGSMNLTPSGYYLMTKLLSSAVPRLVVALEGGYNVTNVALCSEAVLRALLEDAATEEDSPLPPTRMLWFQAKDTIQLVKKQLSPFWPSFQAP